MPRQFYLTADPAPYTPATWKGGWDDTASAVTMRLDSTKTTADLDMFAIQSVTVAESSASAVWRVALARFVSGPMVAQTVGGTLQIMAGVMASLSTSELYYSIHAWVTVGDSDTARGTLLSQYCELASSNNPWPIDPKGRDMLVTAALDSLVILDGDRIVIEIGYVARNESAVEVSGTLYYGTDYYSNGSPDMERDA